MTDTQIQILTAASPSAAPAKSRRPHRTAPTLKVKLHNLWHPHPVTGLTSQPLRFAHSPVNGKLHLCAHDIAVRVRGARTPCAVNNAVRAINGSGRLSQRTGRGLIRGDIKYFNRNFYAVVDGKREVMTSIGRLREYVGAQHHAIDIDLQASVAQLLGFIGARTTIPDFDPTAITDPEVTTKPRKSVRGLQGATPTPPPQIAQAIMDFSPDLGMPMPPDGHTWHNPQGLTAAEIGVGDGWRLLLAGELTAPITDIQCRKLKGSDWLTCEIYKSLRLSHAVAAHYNRLGAFRTRQPLPNGLVWPTAAAPATAVTSLPMEVVDMPAAQPTQRLSVMVANPSAVVAVELVDDVPSAFPSAPEGREWHNPESLTPEQIGVGEGWRLLLTGEVRCMGDQWDSWPNSKRVAWSTLIATSRSLTPLLPACQTHRTRRPLPCAEPAPSVGNPNCARVQFVDDAPATKQSAFEQLPARAKEVIERRLSTMDAGRAAVRAFAQPTGEVSSLPAEVVDAPTQVVAAIPESNGGLLPFDLKGSPVRGLVVDGQPAVVGAEFANAMGYKDPNDAIKRHCKGPVKRRILTQGGVQEVVVIFEPDIYRLIIKSKLKEAQEFERLVFNDILPTIRRTGGYGTQITPPAAGMSVVDVATIVRETVQPFMTGIRELVVDMRKELADQRERTQLDLGWLLQRQANTESEITRQAGLRFPALPAPRSLGDVECPRPGLRLLDEPYLTVSGYKQDYCGNILPCHPSVFGRRVAELCRERGVDTRELSDGGVGYPDQAGYPLSCLHEVRSTEARRQADDAQRQAAATPAGSPLDLPMALAS